MKKLYILVFSFISLQSQCFFNWSTTKAKKEVCTDIKVSFKSEKTVPIISNFDYHENAQLAVELLQNLAEQQQHRKLTIEEMALAIRVISFLFLQEADDYSKGIEIHLKNGAKITLPYSLELCAMLLAQSNSNASPDAEAA